MRDERFDQDLALVLRELAGEPSMSLRYRVADIIAQAPVGRRAWFSPPLGVAAAVVAVVAALALASGFIPHQDAGSPITASPSPSGPVQRPEPSPSTAPEPSPSASPAPGSPRAASS